MIPFNEKRVSEYLAEVTNQLRSSIESLSGNAILNENHDDLVINLSSQFELELPEIDFDSIHTSMGERMVTAENHPPGFDVWKGRSYKRRTIRYHIPFKGNPRHLQLQPTTFYSYMPSIEIIGGEIIFEYVDMYGNVEDVNRQYAGDIGPFSAQYESVKSELSAFNNDLNKTVNQQLNGRKATISRDREDLAKLGFPVKKMRDTAETFSVTPPELREKIALVTNRESANPTLSPTLDPNSYEKILGRIFEIGREFERLPATYSGKSEEDLRDHIWAALSPSIAGSTTGETFNRVGKTDILIKHESTNIFAAECKIWSGPSDFQKAINQLLSYLTWRDSKSALIIFVKNKSVSRVVSEIKKSIVEHGSFKAEVTGNEPVTMRYLMALAEDEGIEIQCSMIVFHIPD